MKDFLVKRRSRYSPCVSSFCSFVPRLANAQSWLTPNTMLKPNPGPTHNSSCNSSQRISSVPCRIPLPCPRVVFVIVLSLGVSFPWVMSFDTFADGHLIAMLLSISQHWSNLLVTNDEHFETGQWMLSTLVHCLSDNYKSSYYPGSKAWV